MKKYTIWLILLFAISFNNFKDKKVENENQFNKEKEAGFKVNLFKFPDTINKKMWISGKLRYRYPKDSLRLNKKHYVFFHVIINRDGELWI